MLTTPTSRRPVSPGRRGVVVGARSSRGLPVLLLTVGLVGCASEEVAIETPDLSAGDSAACAALVDALPDTVAGELRRPVDPDDAPGAAWGDPPVVLTCGVGAPDDYQEASTCISVRGVGWFATEDALEDLDSDVVLTALTVRPRVAVRVPPAHRGSDEVLTTLAKPLRKALSRDGEDCL